jgi:CrcB protein
VDARAVVAVAIGAAIGGVLRYVVGTVFLQRFGPGFPWGTLFINVTGSFLIGIVAELALTRAFGVTPFVRVFAATGLLGGYTTFSTFSLDALTLIGDGALPYALLYAAGSVVTGILGTYAGQVLVRAAAS